MTAARPGRIVLVSDQHLGAAGARPGGPAYDAGFAALVETLTADAARMGTALVLLGDTFDIEHHTQARATGGPPAARAVVALHAIAEEHREVVGALRDALLGGVEVHVVAGNHDSDLHRPVVRDALARLVEPTTARVRFHDWLLHVPGVLLAEHGHRHHDINRPRHVTRPFVDNDPTRELEPTPARVLGAVRHRGARAWTELPAVGRGLAGTLVRPRPVDRAELDAVAAATALPVGAVQRLQEHPIVLPGLVRRLARTAWAARTDGAAPDYLLPSVQRTVDLLAEAGVHVPHYVTGHTHRAGARRVTPRPRGEPVQHLDTGTWSPLVRRTADERRLPTYVDVRVAEDGRSTAVVRRWEC